MNRRAVLGKMSSAHGFRVDAVDGEAGRVQQVVYWSDLEVPDYVVIGRGPWIFGSKTVISTDRIAAVDYHNKRLKVDMSKEEVRRESEVLPA